MTAAALLDVGHRFRGQQALVDVTTSFEASAVTGLLGRNGAGKTTLLRLLAGHLRPTAGRVEVFGQDPVENDRILSRICFVREGLRYPDHFRVRDTLRAAASICPDWDQGLADRLVADFDLPADRAVKKLSRGMTSAVGIVVGLASRAPLTLFDEPYLGLDAVARRMFYDRLLEDYAEHPRTIVISTHLIEEISGLLERVVLVDHGRVVLDAGADDLRGAALTVTGPSRDVDRFADGRDVLDRQTMAGTTRAVVRTGAPGDGDRAAALGLDVAPVPLQDLVVTLSRRATATTTSLQGAAR